MADEKPLELSTNNKTPFLIENILHQNQKHINLNLKTNGKYSLNHNNNNISHNNNHLTSHITPSVINKKYAEDMLEDQFKKSISER